MELKEVFEHLMQRNDQLGLARLDTTDINVRFPFPWFYSRSRGRIAQYAVKLLKVPIMLTPILSRRILQISPYICPTVYYHLGRAYWHAMTWDPDHADKWRSRMEEMCEGALRNRITYKGRHSWGTGRPHLAFDKIWPADMPCTHMTARLGSYMLLTGKMLGKDNYIEAAIESGRVLCEQFDWHSKPLGQLTLNFWPDSDDETINVCADTAILFAELIAAGYDEDGFSEKLDGLLRLVNTEQDAQGKWMYLTREFAEQLKVTKSDNVHSAFVVGGLIRILETGLLETTLAEEAQQVANRGLIWYCKTFFRPSGYAVELDRGPREGTIVSYSEGIACMCHALESDYISAEVKDELDLENLAQATLDTAIRRFVNFKTWDVASYRFGPYHMNIRSIRWGSGVLMEAISHFLAWQENASR